MSSIKDLAIIGGGISGASELMVASCYTDMESIVIKERQPAFAAVNSNPVNNSQTLHMGDIESNYAKGPALKVQELAAYTVGYLARKHPGEDGTCINIHRMLLAVGEREIEMLRDRYQRFLPHYPGMQLLDRDGIATVEPKVVEGRKPNVPIMAIFNPRGFAVDYRALTESFRAEASKGGADIEVQLNEEVQSIEKRARDGLFVIKGGGDEFAARSVMVAAGSSSLRFAQAMGLGRDTMLLPVAGSFYLTSRSLEGKVYTYQNDKIPFAAVHGDPAVYNRSQTRFGPTARPMPILERHHWNTLREFVATGGLGFRWFWNAMRVMKDKDIALFLLKNLGYDLPFFGKRLFLRAVRKIVPSLSARDLRLDRGAGGIRGQLVDMKTGTMLKGMARIDGVGGTAGITFVFAPSPGASGALGSAVEITRMLVGHINTTPGKKVRFDEAGIRRDLLGAARDIGAIAG